DDGHRSRDSRDTSEVANVDRPDWPIRLVEPFEVRDRRPAIYPWGDPDVDLAAGRLRVEPPKRLKRERRALAEPVEKAFGYDPLPHDPKLLGTHCPAHVDDVPDMGTDRVERLGRGKDLVGTGWSPPRDHGRRQRTLHILHRDGRDLLASDRQGDGVTDGGGADERIGAKARDKAAAHVGPARRSLVVPVLPVKP